MKATRRTIPTLIEKREEFSNAGGTVRAFKSPRLETLARIAEDRGNQLDDLEKSRLRIDINANGIEYIVLSYDTPIAWETKNGHIYKVVQKFSQTTSQHQGLLYLMHEKK